MRKRWSFLAVMLLVLSLVLSGQGCRRGERPIQHVVLVSVDGLMPACYLDPDRYELRVPTLRRMRNEGAYSEGMLSVFPSLTYPAHTTMVTGVQPGRHGIVTNLAWDPLGRNQGGWRWYAADIRVPPLWQVAHAKGLRTAMVWWPVTVGAQATALLPEYWRASTAEDAKLLRALSTPGLLEAVEKKFAGFNERFLAPFKDDGTVTDVAVYILETLRPHLLLLHMAQVDHWQHEAGPLAEPTRQAIENADRQIARLLEAAQRAGLWEKTALIVASDHGFAATTRQVRPGVWLREKGLVNLDAEGRVTDWRAIVVAHSGSAYVYVRDEQDATTQAEVLELFRTAAARPENGIVRLYTREDIVARGGDPDAFLALEAAPDFALKSGYTGEVVRTVAVRGEHGYPPELEAMQAALLIYGPAIGAGRIENARMIDLAPTIAAWLGLPFAHAEGRPLELPQQNPE